MHRGPALPMLACLVAGAVAVVGLTVTTPAGAATATSREVAVLGDSYVSGEGLRTATGACGRAPEAWGEVVARSLGDPTPDALACSGAEVADVTVGGERSPTPQVADLAAPVDVAVLLVGGNDLGFAELVAGCLDLDEEVDRESFEGGATSTAWRDLVASGRRTLGCDVDVDDLLARIDGFSAEDAFALPDGGTGRLAAAYAAIAGAAVTDGGTLAVATYPALFDPVDDWPLRYGRRCHGVLAEDATGFRDVAAALNARIEDEAAVAADLVEGRRVVLVDVGAITAGTADATAGTSHGLCGPEVPWLNGLTLVEGGIDVPTAMSALLGGAEQVDLAALGARPTASFHPNSAGHAGIAAGVLDVLVAAGVTDAP